MQFFRLASQEIKCAPGETEFSLPAHGLGFEM